jgi:DMSO/TMAO reductase YedYZ molybdopterin-dependent catalytic subunit
MRIRFVNGVLLALLVALTLTGLGMLYVDGPAWVYDAHRVAGWALVAVLPWKSTMVCQALMRRLSPGSAGRTGLLASLPLAVLLLVVVVLGLMWMWRLGAYQTGVLAQTVIAWHWLLGLASLPFLVAHVVVRWPRPRVADFASRRGMLRSLALGAAALVGWQLGLLAAQARATADRPRRAVTGSRGFGEFTANDFPVTGEPTRVIDTGTWRLRIDGAVRAPLSLTYVEFLGLRPDRLTVTVDCTSGWFSTQEWQGVRLERLLAEAGGLDGAGVRLTSASGYQHSFPMAEARTILLATHVTGEVLAPHHGYPLRAVVPGRRGWFWVKWLVRAEVLDELLAIAAGVACAARQIVEHQL